MSWYLVECSRESIKECITKARAAFFSHGQLGTFYGLLNPLSSRSLTEACIIPVLMYGSESWILNSSLLAMFESFQSEIGKRTLKLSKYTVNSIRLLVLNWPSICTRLLCNKLSFLHSVYNGDSDSLSTQAFRSLAASDVMSMSIVKQSQFLEMLCNPRLSIVALKKHIIEADRQNTIDTAENHPLQRFIAQIARNNLWMKFWGYHP